MRRVSVCAVVSGHDKRSVDEAGKVVVGRGQSANRRRDGIRRAAGSGGGRGGGKGRSAGVGRRSRVAVHFAGNRRGEACRKAERGKLGWGQANVVGGHRQRRLFGGDRLGDVLGGGGGGVIGDSARARCDRAARLRGSDGDAADAGNGQRALEPVPETLPLAVGETV